MAEMDTQNQNPEEGQYSSAYFERYVSLHDDALDHYTANPKLAGENRDYLNNLYNTVDGLKEYLESSIASNLTPEQKNTFGLQLDYLQKRARHLLMKDLTTKLKNGELN